MIDEEGRTALVKKYKGHTIWAEEDDYGWEYYVDDEYMKMFVSVEEAEKYIDNMSSAPVKMVAENKNSKRIFLTENQLKNINENSANEDYDIEPFNHANGDTTKRLKATFDTNLRTIHGARINGSEFKDNYNQGFYSKDINSIVRYIPFDDGNFTINPVTKTLYLSNNTQLRCWALGPLTNADYNHAIKADKLATYDNEVDWEKTNNPDNDKETAKNVMLSYCAGYFSKLIPLAAKVEGIDVNNIKYIAWPQSSKNFNNEFVTGYLMKALSDDGINIEQVIPNIVGKADKMISINYQLAQELGCDDVDIKALKIFLSENNKIQNVICIRQKIERLLSEIRNTLEANGAEEYYQYTTYNNQREELANARKSDLFHTVNDNRENTGLYLDKNNKWKSNNKKRENVLIRKSKSNPDEYKIDPDTKRAIDKLILNKNLVKKAYLDAQRRMQKLAKTDTTTIQQNGKTFNFGHWNTRKDNANSVNANGAHTTGRFLDDTVGDDGSVKNSKWEIKHLPEVYRRVLNDLFRVQDNADTIWQNLDRTKTILLFDDNVAGGTTMSKVCDALLNGPEEISWSSILPITISIMEMSQGMSALQIVKQKQYRDIIANSYGNKALQQQAEESLQFWTGDKDNLWQVNDPIKDGYDMSTIYAQQHQGEEKNYRQFKELKSGQGRVHVFSLNNFKHFCMRNKLTKDTNVASVHPNWVFIEIGSTLNRIQFDMGRTRDFDRTKYTGRKGALNAAKDFYDKGRFYFNSNQSNVLRVEFDDNMKIGDGKNGSTSVKLKGSEIVKDENGYNYLISNDKIDNNKVYDGKYYGAVGWGNVEEEVFNFVEDKINQIGDNIEFFIHCEQGASRSAALGYYITRRINDDVETYFRNHSKLKKVDNDPNHDKLISTQFRIGKNKAGKYKTMHNTIFQTLGKRFTDEYGKTKGPGQGLGSYTPIRKFIDNHMTPEAGDDAEIEESIIKEILNKLL